MASNRSQPSKPMPGIVDHAPRSRLLFDYEIPDEDGLHSEVTQDFGSIRVISIKLLTPLEEKYAAEAAKSDAVLLGFELGRRCIAEVTDSEGNVHPVHNHDGSSNMLWSQMHPKLRSLTMQAYSENSVPTGKTSSTFLASRRIRA